MALAEAIESTPSAAAGPAPQPGEPVAADLTATAVDEHPLTGCLVAVTADRRRDDLASLLRRRGAKVIETPPLRLVPLDDDAALRKATGDCLAAPLEYAVATTGRGWRGSVWGGGGWGA